MLHDFLSANRDELIRRCRSKVSRRDSPPLTPSELDHGVPLFLEQLVWALRCEQESPGLDRDPKFGPLRKTPAAVESSRTAALHGKELLDDGYSVDQVVRDYGDVCQAITELAEERNATVTVGEFRTFNRLLDNAIADAVSSYGAHRDDALGNEQRRILDTAVKAGALLQENLTRLRDHMDRSLPTKP